MAKQPQLFPDPPPAPRSEKTPAPRSVAHGACPSHTGGLTLTGVVRGGRHFYWRLHYVRQGKGARICTASNAPLHSMPARDVIGHKTPICPCGGTPDAT
jgi:hypothetical protein